MNVPSRACDDQEGLSNTHRGSPLPLYYPSFDFQLTLLFHDIAHEAVVSAKDKGSSLHKYHYNAIITKILKKSIYGLGYNDDDFFYFT